MNKRTLCTALSASLLLAACGVDNDGLSNASNSEHATLAGSNSGEAVFSSETGLLERDVVNQGATAPVFADRVALFGDLHVHTENSFDAYTFASLATPDDAYRYARGEAIPHPAGFSIQLDRPLDFYAVTDHAMLLGVAKEAADTSTEISTLDVSEPLHDFNRPG